MAQDPSDANELGLWRATDGKLTALVNLGPANPREFSEVTSTTDALMPLAKATGGDARRRRRQASSVNMPRVIAVRSSDTYKGDDWIGLKMRDASVVRGIGVLPVFAGLLGLLLLVRQSRRHLGSRGRANRGFRRRKILFPRGLLRCFAALTTGECAF